MLLLNQAFMMLWEAILENTTLVIALLLILLISWGYWAMTSVHKKMAHRLAMVLAVGIAAIGFFTLPMMFKASLSDLNYWVDWSFHISMVIALLIYAYVVMLPLATALTGSNKYRA